MAADPDLIALFVRGWSVTRGVSSPVATRGGYYIHVGQPDQKARYVFPALDAGTLSELSGSIREPFVYLKICAKPAEVRPLLPALWLIREPLSFMMTASMHAAAPPLPDGYSLQIEEDGPVLQALILFEQAPVARGRVVPMGDVALFDQIVVDHAHRRKGLGRALMQGLTNGAIEEGASRGLLCATDMGRRLYESIGWAIHAPYTSAVIPG